MQDKLLIVSLVIALGIGLSLAAAGSGILGTFFGVFVGILTGYVLIIALTHFCCHLLPKFGVGSARDEESTARQ